MSKLSKHLAYIYIILFVFICVLDPADKLFHLKVPLFCICYLHFMLCLLSDPSSKSIPIYLLIFILIMICIPLYSVAYYYFISGDEPFKGFESLKSYLFITFSIILYYFNFDITRSLSIILSFLSVLIIGLSLFTFSFPELFLPIYTFGSSTGIFFITNRAYSEDVTMFSAFFVTSPMLVIPISYYVYKLILSKQKREQVFYVLISILNIVAMFLAGTRNNMFFAFLLPLLLFLIYCKKRYIVIIIFSIMIVLLFPIYINALLAMLSFSEESNSVKINLLSEYVRVFSDPIYFLFGHGLGSYFHLNDLNIDTYVTELTYFEVIRQFGIVLGLIIIFLMILPLCAIIYTKKFYRSSPLEISYLIYLIMSATNPHLLSSGGFLIISALIANVFIYRVNSKMI